jgi:hypothetical protein
MSNKRKLWKFVAVIVASVGLVLGVYIKTQERSEATVNESAAACLLVREVQPQLNYFWMLLKDPQVRTSQNGDIVSISTEALERKFDRHIGKLSLDIIKKAEESVAAQRIVALALSQYEEVDPSLPLLIETAWNKTRELGEKLCTKTGESDECRLYCNAIGFKKPEPPVLPKVAISITNHALESLSLEKIAYFALFTGNLTNPRVHAEGKLQLTPQSGASTDIIEILDSNLFEVSGTLASSHGVAEVLEHGNTRIQLILYFNGKQVAKNITFSREALLDGVYMRITKMDLLK